MSLRFRLVLAFTLLALIQAALFTLISNHLLIHGLEAEFNARLNLAGGQFLGGLPVKAWPPAVKAGSPGLEELGQSLQPFARQHSLRRVTLLLPGGDCLDSLNGGKIPGRSRTFWNLDGLAPAALKGAACLAGPLVRDPFGQWAKFYYFKPDPARDAWLRLEAGPDFLGSASQVENGLFRTAAGLGLGFALAGLFLAWGLSRRVRLLRKGLAARPPKADLKGGDEIAAIAGQIRKLMADLEEEKRAREALARAKQDQARSLALGVAHELRNPLGGMALMADLLTRKTRQGFDGEEKRRTDQVGEIVELAVKIRKEVGKMEETVAAFLEFARVPHLEPSKLDLAALADEVGRRQRVRPAVNGGVKAWADEKAARVVLENLFHNASQAAEGPEARVEVRAGMMDGHARLEVWDSGQPVPEDQRAMLFTPFFTTKDKGLGLGLATSASLAQAMGGRVYLEKDGKTFVLELPSKAPVNAQG